MKAYYNEIDPFAAAWLRELITAGHIAPGDVDERSIEDVQADDLKEYTQCHFFAGIGGWSLALRLAGWPDDRPVWTGSCPCQPFSVAGKQGGGDDIRHLWPVWFRLIRECGVNTVFGEQVEGAVGFGWLDRVFADLEDENYACGSAVLGAHSVGAPHIRQRLFWLADAERKDGGRRGLHRPREGFKTPVFGSPNKFSRDSSDGGLADADSRERNGIANGEGRQPNWQTPGRQQGDSEPWRHSENGGLPDTLRLGQPGQGRLVRPVSTATKENREVGGIEHDGRGHWGGAVAVPCADGKARLIEPGIEPLAHGIPARVGRLRGYGNSIVPQAAAQFVDAYMDTAPC